MALSPAAASGRSTALRLLTAALCVAGVAGLSSSCGRTSVLDDAAIGEGGGSPTTSTTTGPVDGCGDRICDVDGGESCTSCVEDCGVCEGCGDGACSASETCGSCAADCGACAGCFDGT